MMLLLSTVYLSDLYLDMELLLLLISPTNLANDMEKIQKCALSIIYPFTSCKDALAKAGITSFKQGCENACVNVKKKS